MKKSKQKTKKQKKKKKQNKKRQTNKQINENHPKKHRNNNSFVFLCRYEIPLDNENHEWESLLKNFSNNYFEWSEYDVNLI